MEIYKYYVNSSDQKLTKAFFSELLGNFNIFYFGNLLWFILFLLSVISLYNIYRNLQRINNFALKIPVFISLILFILIVFSVFIPGSENLDNITGNFIQLNARSTKIAALSIFTILKIFQAVSISVISFSALKKYYLFRSIWLTISVFVLGFILIFVTIYSYKDDSEAINHKNFEFDAGVVLGAAVWGGNRPSPVLRERINKGYELYKNGLIKSIVLTGGGSPGEMTEADVGKNELIKKGVDEKSIFIENRSNSTLEQITYIYRNLYKTYKWKELIIITDNFHLLRSKQMCSFFGMNVRTTASDTPLSSESTFYYCLKESFAIILFWLFGIG
jgi:uncharacterized SAM-binding protein YcdF (DUF218 family)